MEIACSRKEIYPHVHMGKNGRWCSGGQSVDIFCADFEESRMKAVGCTSGVRRESGGTSDHL